MGLFPTGFKVERETHLIKKIGLDVNDTSRFRLILNLPFLSKVFERLVLRRLNCYLHVNNLFPVYQSAYRSGCSTETALLRVTIDIIGSIDAKKVVLLELLDMSAAFDTVDHSILLQRLSHSFGLGWVVLDWFGSFLRGRPYAVTFKGQSTQNVLLDVGVP